tara:strand:- start:433 stop:1191 length:759 start_codon:yes stop_codon:yes gene_type:complete
MKRIESIRNIRSKLKDGKTSIGSWMQIANSSVAEIMGKAGYDWITIDMEHGSFSFSQLPDLCRAIELGGSLPLIRVLDGSPERCKQALDAGAGGLIIPMINSAKELQEIKDYCYWPPKGKRGVGFSRANLFGDNFEEYKEEAQEPLLIAMIETKKAVENLEEILNTDGLDAILIGPYDLSASINLTAQFEHKNFKEILSKVLKKSNQFGIAPGIHIVKPDKKDLDLKINEGYRFLAFSIDALMLLETAKLFR